MRGMRSMRRVGAMSRDDGAVGLLRHDEPEKVFPRLIVGICLRLSAGVFGRYCGSIVGNRGLSLSALN